MGYLLMKTLIGIPTNMFIFIQVFLIFSIIFQVQFLHSLNENTVINKSSELCTVMNWFSLHLKAANYQPNP